MNVCVAGCWHLGSVTAACLASVGHHVVGLDPDPATVAALSEGCSPIAEPGLDELLRAGITDGRLRFTTDPIDATREAEVVWVTYDTPVDDEDRADTRWVEQQLDVLIPVLPDATTVLVSSQLPVGTTRRFATAVAETRPGSRVQFASSPENLRLGTALDAFMRPERIVVGTDTEDARDRIRALLEPITDRIEWMSIESAEMAKHALNAFLATSVAFTNEVANICEAVGADARSVERALRTEPRIGPRAYVSPGAAFAGGTLARDVRYLTEIAQERNVSSKLLEGVDASNRAHAEWSLRVLEDELRGLATPRVAILGLTYKSGTDTLRRSPGLALARALVERDIIVHAHDPAVEQLPAGLEAVELVDDAGVAVGEADAVVVLNRASVPEPSAWIDRPDLVVVDPGGIIGPETLTASRVRYRTVGVPPGERLQP